MYSCNDPKSPISQAILDLIKEKRRLRRLYNNTQDPNTKSTINKLQKEIRTKINQESTISWEKFYNSISLESDPKKSWRKITNFLKPKGPRSYPTPNAGINFIHNHPPPLSRDKPPGHDLKGAKILPLGQLLCTKTLPSGQERESKAPPPGHKVREFHKHIYEL